MGKLLETIPFLIQAILVVAGVLVFSFFDPLEIFTSSKLKLKDTPVDIQSIREIGQLITAEYYGEVISSSSYQIREKNQSELEDVKDELEELNLHFWDVINELRVRYKNNSIKRTRKNVYQAYNDKMGVFLSSNAYDLYLYYTFRKLVKEKEYKSRHLDDDLNENRLEKFIQTLVKNGKISIADDDFVKDLIDRYHEQLLKEERKITKKSNLVMLGRGWVKAGFDFEEFSEEKFRYDAGNGTINFVGFTPSILSATINPWFIPEKGMEGFEFLIVERKVKRDYKVVQSVKQKCLEELKRKAIVERQILNKAVKNAEINMKEFFSLLLEKPVKQVRFFSDELTFAYQEIIKNDSISGEELIMIHELLGKEAVLGVEMDALPDRKQAFIDSIQTWLQQKDHRMIHPFKAKKWTPYLSLFYEVTKDGVFSEFSDHQRMKRYQKYCSDSFMQDSGVGWAEWSGDLIAYIDSTAHLFILKAQSEPGVQGILESNGGRRLHNFTYSLQPDSMITEYREGSMDLTISYEKLRKIRQLQYQADTTKKDTSILNLEPFLANDSIIGYKVENELNEGIFKRLTDLENVKNLVRCPE